MQPTPTSLFVEYVTKHDRNQWTFESLLGLDGPTLFDSRLWLTVRDRWVSPICRRCRGSSNNLYVRVPSVRRKVVLGSTKSHMWSRILRDPIRSGSVDMRRVHTSLRGVLRQTRTGKGQRAPCTDSHPRFRGTRGLWVVASDWSSRRKDFEFICKCIHRPSLSCKQFLSE